MKSLVIKSNNCLLSKTNYDVQINDKNISELILENLPKELKSYKDYLVQLSIEIEILGDEDIKIITEGYDVKEEYNETLPVNPEL